MNLSFVISQRWNYHEKDRRSIKKFKKIQQNLEILKNEFYSTSIIKYFKSVYKIFQNGIIILHLI